MNKRSYITKDKTLALKGIFAIFVLMHHLYQYSAIITGTIFGSIFQAMGYLSVAVFFFLSGYGLSKSVRLTGGAYLLSFPRKRLLTYYVDIIIFLLLYLVLNIFRSPDNIAWLSILKSLTFGGTLISNGWYLQVALILYIIFFFVYRFVKFDKCKPWIMLGLTITFVAVLHFSGFSSVWYEGMLAFPLGLLLATYEEKLYTDNLKANILIIVISFVLFCGAFIGCSIIDIKELSLILKMHSTLLFVIFVLSIVRYIPIICKPTLYLGKISLEIYALQGLFIWILKIDSIADLDVIYRLLISIGIFVVVIAMAALINPVITKTNQFLSGGPRVKSAEPNQEK